MLAAGKMPENETGDAFVAVPQHARSQGFNWRRALSESFAFLAIEQAYVIHDDYRWITIENGVPFKHYRAGLQEVARNLDPFRMG